MTACNEITQEVTAIDSIRSDPHHLFPEADCLVLERMETLLQWLPRERP